ncbi:hypothetical protein BUALT_Bualt01G0140500 [Buddleja alternifolia]|uniref:Heparan-alpha-glucosaminide N-acetyltransferase n=1 Tax=Buddleja alternifolia TaxID=168488 RepID=A0AAV6YHF7_9LAMI|nr:hypothetical protein BUALT_Bualt01G0140500 [Buddleja alternifolia]
MADIKEDVGGHHHQHLILAVESEGQVEKQLHEEEAKREQSSKTKRVASLDIFRGLTVALMILVDDAGGEWPVIGHAPWNGCNLADFVMPFFLFIVGMAVALSLKRIQDRKLAINKVILRTLKLIFWGLLLQDKVVRDTPGDFDNSLSDFYSFILTNGRSRKKQLFFASQRIALAYLVVAFIEILARKDRMKGILPGKFSIFKLYFWHWFVGGCVLIVYLATLYGTYVPDWHFIVQNADSADFGKVVSVGCNVRGKLDPPCNAVGYIDRKVLGINHMYQHPTWKRSQACTKNSPHEGRFRVDAPSWCWAPFEPEGILSSISAILSAIIGVHCGHVLVHMKGHSSRLQQWTMMGFGLLILGFILHFTDAIPLNKQLYTLSYVCVTCGAAALVFSTFYILVRNLKPEVALCLNDNMRYHLDLSLLASIQVDIWNLKYLFLPLEWIGMNAMLVYVMAAEGIFAGFINGWYYDNPNNTLVHWIQKHIFIKVWHSTRVGILLYVIFAEILFWGLVAGLLHRFSIYWKL